MKAKFEHIQHQRNSLFQIEKFDHDHMCSHEGLHFHNSYEIVFIKNGRGKITVENKSVEYENGALIFLGPRLPHFGFSNQDFDDNYEVVIHFDEQFVEERIRRIPEFLAMIPFIRKSTQVMLFSPAFKEKQTATLEDIDTLNPMEQLATIFSLLSKFYSSGQHTFLMDRPLDMPYSSSGQVEKIFDYINDNYSRQISTRDIAQHLNITTNSFCKMFKKLTQKSFISYLNEYRIHRASQLLEHSDYSISEVAYQCGFENLSYFSKVFLQIKKRRPIDYKNDNPKVLMMQ